MTSNVEVLRSGVIRDINLRATLPREGSYVFCNDDGVMLRLSTGRGGDRPYVDSPRLPLDDVRALARALIEVAYTYEREVARWQIIDLYLRDEPEEND